MPVVKRRNRFFAGVAATVLTAWVALVVGFALAGPLEPSRNDAPASDALMPMPTAGIWGYGLAGPLASRIANRIAAAPSLTHIRLSQQSGRGLFAGSGEPLRRIVLLQGGKALADTLTDAGGNWQIATALRSFSGTHLFSVEQLGNTDLAMYTSSRVIRVHVPVGHYQTVDVAVDSAAQPFQLVAVKAEGDDIGSAASRRFDEILTDRDDRSGSVEQSRRNEPAEDGGLLDPAWNWLRDANRSYTSEIVPRIKRGGGYTGGVPVINDADRETRANQAAWRSAQNNRDGDGRNGDADPDATGLTAGFWSWLEASRRGYSTEVVPRLKGEMPDVRIARPRDVDQEDETETQRQARLERERRLEDDAAAKAERERLEAERRRREAEERRQSAEEQARKLALERRRAEEEEAAKLAQEQRRAAERRAEAARLAAEAERRRAEAARDRQAEIARGQSDAEREALERQRLAEENQSTEEADRRRREADAERAAAERRRAERERRNQLTADAEDLRRRQAAAERREAEERERRQRFARRTEPDNSETRTEPSSRSGDEEGSFTWRDTAIEIRRRFTGRQSRTEPRPDAPTETRSIPELPTQLAARSRADRRSESNFDRQPRDRNSADDRRGRSTSDRSDTFVRRDTRIVIDGSTRDAASREQRRVADARVNRRPPQARVVRKPTSRLRKRRRVASHRRSRCSRRAGRRINPPGTYVVKRGDSLWTISRRHYRLGRLFPKIHRANLAKIKRARLIYPCQRFHLPRRR